MTVNSSNLGYCSIFHWNISWLHSTALDFSWQWGAVTWVSAPYCPNSPTFTPGRTDLPIQIHSHEEENADAKNKDEYDDGYGFTWTMILLQTIPSQKSFLNIQIGNCSWKRKADDRIFVFCLGLGMRIHLTLMAFFNPRFIHQPLQPFSPSPIHPPIVWPVSSIFLFSQFPIFSFPALTANGGWPWLHYVNLCNSQDPPMDVGQSGYLGNFIKTAKTSLVGMQINILLSNDKMAQRHSIYDSGIGSRWIAMRK